MEGNTCLYCGSDMGENSICPHCERQRKTTDNRPGTLLQGLKLFLVIFFFLSFSFAVVFYSTMNKTTTLTDAMNRSSNKSIGTATEMYSTDNSSHYPASGSAGLSPSYMKNIPTCQATDSDTYTADYSVGTTPDAYTFFPGGDSHTTEEVIDEASEKEDADSPERYFLAMEEAVIVGFLSEIPQYEVMWKKIRESNSASYSSGSEVEPYTFHSNGDSHTQLTDEDYPQYNSSQGLVTRP